MRTQHTPGPWRWADGYQASATSRNAPTVYIPGREVCKLSSLMANEHQAEAKANARLIAAAPDLLDACRLAARNAEAELYMLPVDADRAVRTCREKQVAIYRAALAKATGEAVPQ